MGEQTLVHSQVEQRAHFIKTKQKTEKVNDTKIKSSTESMMASTACGNAYNDLHVGREDGVLSNTATEQAAAGVTCQRHTHTHPDVPTGSCSPDVRKP